MTRHGLCCTPETRKKRMAVTRYQTCSCGSPYYATQPSYDGAELALERVVWFGSLCPFCGLLKMKEEGVTVIVGEKRER